MTEQEAFADSDPTALYEIRLQGTSTDPLRQEFPTATVFTTRTETVLFPRVEHPAELDELIDHLLSRGFVLTEVHQVRSPDASAVGPRNSSSEEGLSDDENV